MVFRLSLGLSVIKSMVVMIDMNHENILGLEVSLLLALGSVALLLPSAIIGQLAAGLDRKSVV